MKQKYGISLIFALMLVPCMSTIVMQIHHGIGSRKIR